MTHLDSHDEVGAPAGTGHELEKSAAPPASRSPDRTMLHFLPGDPGCAANWSRSGKVLVLIVGVLLVTNSTMGSSLPGGASAFLASYFDVSNQQQLVLPNSLYLVGYVLGPPVCSPLSETYGRRVVLIVAFAGFTIFTMACAVAPTWPGLLVLRFLVGAFASGPITVVGGMFADIYDDPVSRGRSVAVLIGCTTLGPVIGPVISGFASPLSWRWTFWIALIIAGASWPPLLFLPESFGPVILARRARAIRAKGSKDTFAPIELEAKGVKHMMTVTLVRPILMFAEPIVLCSCLYLAFEYAIFYLFFEAYPIVFQGIYHMSTGVAALALVPVAIGAILASFISLWYDRILRRAKDRQAMWSMSEEYRRLPLACVGGPFHVISLFWLGWTARPDTHWIVPMLSGVSFGIGIELTFISLLNYLTDAYEIFAASAMASSAFSRSLFACVLPLAADPMYRRLGVPWASSLLGFLSLVMAVVPFILIRYGEQIRKRSKFCQHLVEQKRRAAAESQMEISK
ncbi:MAG: hypothetical protein ALECFALPRED_006072 [Alectoria fallacina]|uniref:Major facilitator superfamily (MFS) profile domain-containing protein n=1 Tax=Alectoria fallacina TaxID=1903189 RepID=A0A8H3G1Y2_9LECA|nr:MAG: hypothetical protein ALECFALPRED_006072 [Alectoria fallacina]